jgi:hypothetical protein
VTEVLPKEMPARGNDWLGGSLHAYMALILLLHLNKIIRIQMIHEPYFTSWIIKHKLIDWIESYEK